MQNNSPISREIIGLNLLERYTGSSLSEFQSHILLVNTRKYLEIFAAQYNRRIIEGSSMGVCHDEKHHISIINYGIGSPVAALIIELLSFIKPKATLMLGLCGGLRKNYQVGDYFNPVAAIRGEGTSYAYMPKRCPSLSSFIIQRYVCEELERNNKKYYNGVIHTTNMRFWEFKEDFRQQLLEERVQAIDMECATLFTVGFAHNVAVGALMLVSDLPLTPEGIKTKDSAKKLAEVHSLSHLVMGVNVLINMQKKETIEHDYQF